MGTNIIIGTILITVGFCTLFFGTWILILKEHHKKAMKLQRYDLFAKYMQMKFKLEKYATALENKLNKLEGNEKETVHSD